MTQLNSLERKQFWDWGRTKPRQRMAYVRKVLTHEGAQCRELETIDVKHLAALNGALPSNRLTTPVLASVRKKFKRAIAAQGGVQPHQEPPGTWPKVFRMKSSGGGNGLMKTGGGQWVKMSEQALSYPLPSIHRWNTGFAGDLIIVGTRNEVVAAIRQAGGRMICQSSFDDMFKGDVGHEFDRMYGDIDDAEHARQATVPLFVEVVAGISMEETQDDFEVVLNPRGEVVNQAGNKLAGVAGGGGGGGMNNETLEMVALVKDRIEDSVIPVIERVVDVKRGRDEARAEKARMSVRVGIGKRGNNALEMGTRFDGTALCGAVTGLMANL